MSQASSTAELTVIIPTLNDGVALAALLPQLQQQTGLAFSVLVSDGNSSDNCREVAAQHGATVVQGEPGRGAQLNRAAKLARSDYLLFLHADSGLTHPSQLAEALSQLQAAEANRPHAVAGHFPLHFVNEHAQRSRKYRYLEAKTLLNRPNTTNGDQGFMLQRRCFWAHGGFSSRYHFLEDQDFAERFRQTGQWLSFMHPLQTSNRRFEQEGFRQRYTLMTLIMLARELGLWRFIEEAPGLYRSHADLAKHKNSTPAALRLNPFLAHFRQLVCKLPLRQRLANFYQAGNFARRNSWQLFLLLDIRSGAANEVAAFRLLRLHDHYVAPLLALPIIKQGLNLAAATVLGTWLFAVLPILERFQDLRNHR